MPSCLLANHVTILGILGILGLLLLCFAFLFLSALFWWLQGVVSGCRIPLLVLVGMRLRKTDRALLVQSNIHANKAGLDINHDQLETHFLAGGDLAGVIIALIAADKAGLALDWGQATGIDLAGRDVLQAVKTSITPIVIDCPNPESGKEEITGVAKDGIQVRARVRVTVRSNLEQLIGGATEETIIARVGEGIISSIGCCHSYRDILKNPSQIAKVVLDKGLDSGSAFRILSIDIADLEMGANIGAWLQTSQAAADLCIARARAEDRRAMAVAMEQEQRAKVVGNQALVVLAEATIPPALSAAFRQGRLWSGPSLGPVVESEPEIASAMRAHAPRPGFPFLSSHFRGD